MKPLSKLSGIFSRSFGTMTWVLKLYWKMSPFYTSASVVTEILHQFINIASSFVLALSIDVLLEVSSGQKPMEWLYIIILIIVGVSIFRLINDLAMRYSNRYLDRSLWPHLNMLRYQKMSKMEISTLERPEINNLVDRASRNTGHIQQMFYNTIYMMGVVSGIFASGAVVFSIEYYFVPLFIVTLIPSLFIDRKFMAKLWKYDRDISEKRRKAYDSSSVLQDPKSLQEVNITGAYYYLSHFFERFFRNNLGNVMKIQGRWYRSIFGFRLFRASVEAYAAYVIFLKFIRGVISIGNVTFYFSQVSNFMNNLTSFGNTINSIYEGALYIDEVKSFFENPEVKDGDKVMDRLEKGPDINITDVTFAYPGQDKPVIKDLDLEIKSGEKIAIVGHNGAGKTTLVKLLLRFYKVNKGSILINGTDVNDLKINDYYKNVSALFQEYNTYGNLNVEQNILMGRPTKKLSKKRLYEAARYADVDDFVGEYKKKYKQILSERYKGGIRPSTGQWQKIAIARFFYRNAPLVIFDEPTAAIDAVAEAKIFNRIYKFFKNKTVIIISHRFSTVRNADRIIVFDKGKIVEQGSHEELMKANGKYASAFRLQAEGYK